MDGKATEGIRFKENINIGDSPQIARCFNKERADEIVFSDSTALSDRRDIMIDIRETGRAGKAIR
ncbi:MAG: hypothetical protein JRJ45_08755 [Deltaproteobacteria bacterium]|nr:hypothetical protein [Deltaproteobacteria bacterium]